MRTPLLVTEVVPQTFTSFDVATDDGKRELQSRYGRTDAAYVRLNMITSLTGSAVGADGTSETLTSRVDRGILGAIRRDADVVLVGAQTVRAEGYIVPRTARLAVVTSSGDLAGLRLRDDDDLDDRVLVLCPAEHADAVADRVARPGIRIVPVPADDGMRPAGILDALANVGHRRVVCEGGPTLATAFAAAGLIDEYCLTVAPALEPTEHPFLQLTAENRPATGVAGMLVDGAGFSYLRLRIRR